MMETTVRAASTRLTTETSRSQTNLIFTFFLVGLFLIFPYWSGMFFPAATAASGIYVSLALLMVMLWGIFRKAEVTHFAKLDLLALLYTLVVLCSVFTYSNLEFTLTGIAKQFSFLFFYLVVRLALAKGIGTRLMLWIVSLSSGIFSAYGLLLGFNVVSRQGGLFDERRIASVFEYPNSFASYLTIGLLFGLVMQMGLQSWWARFAVNSLNCLTLMTLILTNSRGGWLVFLIVLSLTILFSPQGRRAGLSLNFLATAVSVGAGLPFVNTAVQAGALDRGLAGMAIALVVAFVYALLSQRMIERVNRLNLKLRVVLPALTLILLSVGFGALKMGLIPDNIAQRITSINFQQFSVVQRFVFYKDGFSALRDHPLIGAGDKTWETLFAKYQSYPYYTTNPHSVIVDQAMNAGLLGLILFLSISVLTGVAFWKMRREQGGEDALLSTVMLGGLVALIGHALIDVDFSYAVMGYLFWLLVALAANRQPLQLKVPGFMAAMNWQPKNRWVWWLGALMALSIAIFDSTYVYADSQVQKAKAEAEEPEVALKRLDKVDGLAPYMTSIHGLQAELEEKVFAKTNNPMYRSNVVFRLQKLSELSEKPELLLRTGQKLVKHQKTLEGYALVKQAWQNGPYYAEFAEQFIIYAVQIGEALTEQKHPEKAKEFYQDALNTHEELKRRIEGLKELPPVLHLERPYEVNPRMKEYLAIAYYRLGQYPVVEQLTAEAKGGPNVSVERLNALLLAAQLKQGKQPDQNFMQSVLNNPDAAALYQTLAKQP
jgi:O-antigen ligase